MKEISQEVDFKELSFDQRMQKLKERRVHRERLENQLAVLKRKLKTVQMFDTNFFAKLEEASKEQQNMQFQLETLV